jgi:hypothetical protein
VRRLGWIWFAGCAAWFIDGVFWLRLRAVAHARLAFMLALLFLAAGLFYRRQQR